LAQLTDDELLTSTRRLVGKTNQLLAALLLHLAEVEVRGAHRTRSCASLYTYCIYELRFSEDAAARRSAAARFVKQFPALLDAVAEGELHLTGAAHDWAAPHAGKSRRSAGASSFSYQEGARQAGARAESAAWVPDLVHPLGPEPMPSCRNPTWAELVVSLCPPMRELPAGARPSDGANEGACGAMAETTDREGTEEGEQPVGGTLDRGEPEGQTLDGGVPDSEARDSEARDSEVADAELPVGRVPADLPPVTSPQRYQLQFETTEEHVQLLERAKALVARKRPGASLGELHLEAMKVLVASLEKRKFAVGARARQRRPEAARVAPVRRDDDAKSIQPRQRGAEPERVAPLGGHDDAKSIQPRRRGATESVERGDANAGNAADGRDLNEARAAQVGGASGDNGVGYAGIFAPQRVRNRHIPAALQREIYQRDAGRCSYVDSRGWRCCETRYLELHHLEPFAKGGAHATSNLTLRCTAHNRLAAERDFGQGRTVTRRDAARHESLARQLVRNSDN
jgi:hypothetical protein